MLRICVLVGEFRKQREESEGEIQDAKVGFRFVCPACKERVTGLQGRLRSHQPQKKRRYPVDTSSLAATWVLIIPG